ncbi:MAG: hypothetical protein ACP5JH_10825 [Bacteroidota bacterium]
MKKVIMLSIITLSLLSFVGCMTVQLTSEGVDKPASMTSNVNKKFTIVKHFSRDLKGWFTIFNLVTISNPKVDEVIRNELVASQGDAVINIKIQGQTTFLDGFIPVALGTIGALVAPPWGFYASSLIGVRTYTVEGDVIRYTE